MPQPRQLVSKLFPQWLAREQGELQRHWQGLDPASQSVLLKDLQSLNEKSILQLQEALQRKKDVSLPRVMPYTDYTHWGESSYHQRGMHSLEKGELASLIVAGGQGSRLRFDGPKGLYPVSPVHKKSLFQLFAERCLAASLRCGSPLSLAIMTSPRNHEATVEFFSSHNFFGLEKDQVQFFPQGTLPLLDEGGNIFLETPTQIARGPDGNGDALKHFYDSGLWQAYWDKGVRHLHFMQVDNALADPFDVELLGYHVEEKAEVTIKSILREGPEEKVGVLVQEGGKLRVLEYSEIAESEKTALGEDGKLLHPCANISAFCFSMRFIERVGRGGYRSQPLHLAHKAARYLNEEGETVLAPAPMAWKFEKFIFDVLPFSEATKVLVYPRELCYAPLKNGEGEHSPSTVASALVQRDHRQLKRLGYQGSLKEALELPAQYYYPTPTIIDACHRGKLEGV